MFLGYYMFLLSQTIKEEILPTPLLPTEKYRYRLYLILGNTDTEKMAGTTVVCNTTNNAVLPGTFSWEDLQSSLS